MQRIYFTKDQVHLPPSFASAYLFARRSNPSGIIEINIVQNQEGQVVDFGSPSEWLKGTAARVLSSEYQVKSIVCDSSFLASDIAEKGELLGSPLPSFRKRLPSQLVSAVEHSPEHQPHRKSVIGQHASSNWWKYVSCEKCRRATEKIVTSEERESQTHTYEDDLPYETQFVDGLLWAACSKRGCRETNEDEYSVVSEFSKLIEIPQCVLPPQFFCGVFDGHGGREAAEFCRQRLHVNIAREMTRHPCICDAMAKGYVETDKQFTDVARAGRIEAGSTCLSLLLTGRHLSVANAGDCRLVLCRGGRAVELTLDHRTNRLDEQERIEQEGGYVQYGYLCGTVEVTRAMGDVSKSTGRKLAGLTAVPETTQLLLTEEDEFLVMGCDGLWEAMKPRMPRASAAEQSLGAAKKVMEFVRQSLARHNDLNLAAEELVLEAISRNSDDNVTAVLVAFPKHGTSTTNSHHFAASSRRRRGSSLAVSNGPSNSHSHTATDARRPSAAFK